MSCKEDLCYVRDTMLTKLKEHCCDPNADARELGEVADIIKDMCEAEYYCKVTDAMDKKLEDPYSSEDMLGYPVNGTIRYGYPIADPYEKTSYYGYRPFVDQEPYVRDYLGMNRGMTVGGRMGFNSYDMDMNKTMEYTPQHGKAYMEYERSRKHYTQTKDENDKKEMNKHMDEHVRDVVATVRQMWTDADPAQRMHLRTDIQSLLDGMKD